MIWDLIESERDGGWAVERIHQSGEVSRVLFTGNGCEDLAREYADIMNAAAAAMAEPPADGGV